MHTLDEIDFAGTKLGPFRTQKKILLALRLTLMRVSHADVADNSRSMLRNRQLYVKLLNIITLAGKTMIATESKLVHSGPRTKAFIKYVIILLHHRGGKETKVCN